MEDKLTPKDQANNEQPRVLEQIIDLVRLAEIVVEFKQFSHDFPDPMNSKRRPDRQCLETMNTGCLESMNTGYRDLTQKMQANDSILRTYHYFRRMLNEVIENDVRRLNQWNLRLRRMKQP